jgi:hypothetical protein
VGSALLSTFPQPIWILKVQQRQAIRSRLGYTQRIYRNKVAQSVHLFLQQRFYHETMLGTSEIAPGVEQEEC